MADFKVGDRVRTGRRVTHCDAYPYAVYVILAGPFESAYDDGSAKWSEYVGAFAEDGFRDIGKATLHTIDASNIHRVCAHDQVEAHDTGLYEPGKPAHHGFPSIWCNGPSPAVPMIAMTPERMGVLDATEVILASEKGSAIVGEMLAEARAQLAKARGEA